MLDPRFRCFLVKAAAREPLFRITKSSVPSPLSPVACHVGKQLAIRRGGLQVPSNLRTRDKSAYIPLKE